MVTASGSGRGPSCTVALWMAGFGSSPEALCSESSSAPPRSVLLFFFFFFFFPPSFRGTATASAPRRAGTCAGIRGSPSNSSKLGLKSSHEPISMMIKVSSMPMIVLYISGLLSLSSKKK